MCKYETYTFYTYTYFINNNPFYVNVQLRIYSCKVTFRLSLHAQSFCTHIGNKPSRKNRHTLPTFVRWKLLHSYFETSSKGKTVKEFADISQKSPFERLMRFSPTRSSVFMEYACLLWKFRDERIQITSTVFTRIRLRSKVNKRSTLRTTLIA